jgi:hypothetical protein
MIKTVPKNQLFAVDDVLIVLRKIAWQHAGNIHEHVKQSRQAANGLAKKLGLKLVSARATHRRSTTR